MSTLEILLRNPGLERAGRRDPRAGLLAMSAGRADDGGSLDLVVGDDICSLCIQREHLPLAVRDLLAAVLSVAEGRVPKARVSFSDTPWELCVTAGDDGLCVSVYGTGPVPEVRVLDQPVSRASMRDQLVAMVDALRDDDDTRFVETLRTLRDRVVVALERGALTAARRPSTTLQWSSRPAKVRDAVKVRLSAELPGAWETARSEHPQADLHALLYRGRLSLELRGRRIDLAPGFVALQVERLISLCRPLLEAWAARRAFHLRLQVADLTLGVRLGVDERLVLSLMHPREGSITLPGFDPRALVGPLLECAAALAFAHVQADRSQAKNLRLRAMRTEARVLRRWLRDLDRRDSKVNAEPALYRTPEARVGGGADMNLSSASRLRYTQRWHAEIEGLDLSGTLLCGGIVVVPGVRELHGLDRDTGSCVWTVAAQRAATTLAGEDILRLTSKGEVELRDVETGDVIWSRHIAPRVGAPALACAVTAPGLPRIVVVAEGERRLVALDLRTGEARWTYSARHGGTFRMRRAGRLLIVVSGDAAVTAIDLSTGEPVWRFADRVPFTTTPLIHRDTVFALAGEGGRGPARLYALGAYSGELQWSYEGDSAACCAPTATDDTVALGLSTREGMVLAGRRVDTGEERFVMPLNVHTGTLSARPAVTAFDEQFVINLPTGRVLSVDAQDGHTRWSQTFAAPLADDVPRRLDPQLRAGALFVPQRALAVLRPRDGSVLADVEACDLVPDLVRVDERCAIYVAEESGHLGCYELGARLRVLQPV